MLSVRPAHEGDVALLLAWRNDPVTRAASLDSGVVSEQSHRTWFSSVLADPTRRILIGMSDDRPIGMVRFDTREDGIEVSINLSPDARGQGASRPLLDAGVAELDAPPGTTLLASIRESNTASLRLFHGAGFREDRRNDGVVSLSRTL